MIVKKLSAGERLKNAVRAAALMLALAVAAVFVPVFHFVLVPLFLLLALVMGAMEYKKATEVSDLNVECENCKVQVDMSQRTSQDLLMKYCPSCNHQVTFRLQP